MEDTLVGHSCGTLFCDTLSMLRAPQWHGASQMHFPPRPRKSAWHCADVIPPHGPPHTRSKRITRYQQSSRSPVARRDTSKSHTSSQSPKRVLRSRRPQTLTLEVRKASVSHETSSKSHTPSLQNERFVRDFLKNSHVKVCKQAFRTRLPPKVKREAPSEHKHQAALPSSFAIPAPPNNTRSLANPNVTATFTSITTHNLTIPCACHETFRAHTSNAHKVLRLPRNVTSVTPRNFTIPCACHENRASIIKSPHKVLRLPRKVTISISYHVSFNRLE